MMDWINSIPPEWLLVMWCGIMAICLGVLLIVLVWATNPDNYRGTRRSNRVAGAHPYSSRPGRASRLRTAPYVEDLELVREHGRHRAPEPGPTRDLANPWRPTRRETL